MKAWLSVFVSLWLHEGHVCFHNSLLSLRKKKKTAYVFLCMR